LRGNLEDFGGLLKGASSNEQTLINLISSSYKQLHSISNLIA